MVKKADLYLDVPMGSEDKLIKADDETRVSNSSKPKLLP